MTTQKKLMTAEELLMLPDDGRRYELLDGALVEMSPAGRSHNRTLGKVSHPIMTHVWAHRLGEVLVGDTGIILRRNPDRVRAPDICFIAQNRLPPEDAETSFLEIVPDLVVEIVSRWDRPREVRAKAQEWIDSGARLVWVVDPRARTVAVYRNGAPVRTYTEADTLDAEPVLPGFSVAVADLFS